MSWLISALGAVLIVLALRDMFHTLWHPNGQGRFANALIRSIWRLTRKLPFRFRPTGVSGPLALVAVIATWATLLMVGFALVYWPRMPEGFILSSGLDANQRSHLLDAFYLSMVTLATLGYGDIVPKDAWLLVVGPFQAFCGFALLSAAVSWAMQVYPVLGRRRTLALRLALLTRAGAAATVADGDSPSSATLLHELAADLCQVRVDVEHYTETVYFHERDEVLALGSQLSSVLRLTEAAAQSARPDVRASGRVLYEALDDLARVLAGHFGDRDGETAELIETFAREHAPG